MQPRECRLQDTKNRQNSIELDITVGQDIRQVNWNSDQAQVWGVAVTAYKHALEQGIAKEVARALLPEGLTPSRLYMNGNMRSWIFYLKQRLHPSTQKEHRVLAQEILSCLRPVAPVTMAAFFPTQEA
jgi:thymidylate synthase (FAD)